jgi:hypothetical protein
MSNAGGNTILDFKLYYIAIVTTTKKSMELAQKQTQTKKQNRRSKNKPTQRQPYDFWQRCQKPYVGEQTASSPNGVEKTGYPHIQDWSYTPIFHPVQKINSKWIKVLNVKTKTEGWLLKI